MLGVNVDERDAIFSPYIESLGLQTTLMEGGKTEMFIPMQDVLLNSNDMVHGGVIATLLDTAAAAAARTVLDNDTFTPTIDLHINYLVPARKEKGDLHGFGQVVMAGKSVAHSGAEARQGDIVVARAIGVFRVLQFKPQ